MNKKYVVYVIRNTDNNLIYIGKTYMGLQNRFKAHMRAAFYEKNKYNKFAQAIREIGIDNFYIEALQSYDDRQSMDQAETIYIKKFDSIKNGYNTSDNQIDYTKISNVNSAKLISIGRKKFFEKIVKNDKDQWKNKISKTIQANNKGKQMLGVSPRHGNRMPRAVMFHQGVKYSKSFVSVVECQECYDKWALYLHGEDAALNFPDKKHEYLLSDLHLFFEQTAIKKYSSKYIGVSWSSSKKVFLAAFKFNNKKLMAGSSANERVAAKLHDYRRFIETKSVDKLNFPDRVLRYNLDIEKINKIYNRYHSIKSIFGCTSKYLGVSKYHWGFLCQKSIGGKHYNESFQTEIEAAEFYDVLSVMFKHVCPLNFPEKIDIYKSKNIKYIQSIVNRKPLCRNRFGLYGVSERLYKGTTYYLYYFTYNKKHYYKQGFKSCADAAKAYDKQYFLITGKTDRVNDISNLG